MNEQLIAPILERISLGYGKEDIKKEVMGFGYGEEDFEAAYSIALARSGNIAKEGTSDTVPGPESASETANSGVSPGPATTAAPQKSVQAIQTDALPNGGDVSLSKKGPPQHFLMAGIVLVLFAVVAVGGVFAYKADIFSTVSIFSGAPFDEDHVVRELATFFSNIESTAYVASVSVESVPRDEDTYPFPAEADSSYEYGSYGFDIGQTLPSDFKLLLSLSGGIVLGKEIAPNAHLQAAADLDMDDLKVAADVEFITTENNELFIKINKFPSLFFDLSDIKGEWIKLTEEDLGKNFMNDFDSESESEMAAEQAKIILKLADKHSFIEVEGTPEKEDVNGTAAYKYHLKINADTATAFYTDTINTLGSEYGEQSILSEYDLEDLTNPKYIEYYNKHMPLYIWADKKGAIVRMSVESRLVFDSSDESVSADDQINASFTIDFSDINKPVIVDVPKTSITIEEVGRRIPMFGALDAARDKGADAAIKSTMNNMRAQAEIYYDDSRSYLGFCASYQYVRAMSALDDYAYDQICSDTETNYMLEALLLNGNFYCVDSTGYAGESLFTSKGLDACKADSGYDDY